MKTLKDAKLKLDESLCESYTHVHTHKQTNTHTHTTSQPALQCALSYSLSTLTVVVHEHLPKPLSTHYNGNLDDEPEFRSLEPTLQSLQPAGNFEVSGGGGGGVMDGFPPTCPVLSTHPLCCASPGTLFATVRRTDTLIQ